MHASLPTYAGGLGVLAGDLLRRPRTGGRRSSRVGLLYRRGYFHQRLDPTGLQHEYWTTIAPQQLSLEPACDAAGAQVSVQVPIRGRSVRACVWRAQVGRIPLYLLDTDVPANTPIDRFITAQLYVGDREYRLMRLAALAGPASGLGPREPH